MSDNNDINTNNKTSQPPKQLLVLLTIFSLTLITASSNGLYMKKYGLGAIPVALSGAGVILMLILTKWKGRRFLFMTLFILSLLSSIIYLCHLEYVASWYELICLLFHAPVQGSAIALLYIVICEYCDPKRRFLFLVANSAIQRVSFWTAVVLQANDRFGDFLQYCNIILAVVGLWSVFKWPESPYWLASKGRFEEIKKAFVEVRGGLESSEELQVLTDIDARARPVSAKMIYAPLLIAVPVLCMTIPFYDIFTINQTFELDDVLTYAYKIVLILQYITALACVLTFLIPVALPRKQLFLSCGYFFASDFLYILITGHRMPHLLHLIYNVIVDYGPRTVTLPLLIELVPQKFMSSVTIFITLLYNTMEFFLDVVVRWLPAAGNPIFLVLFIICYFIMPEVKEKTLVEIEQLYLPKEHKSQSVETDL